MSIRALACLLLALLASLPAAQTPAAPANETAAQFYLRYRAVALDAKSMDEITAFWTADTVHQFNMEPESVRTETFGMAKRLYRSATDVRVVKETPTATGVMLSMEGVGPDEKPVVGSVEVVKEKGGWRVSPAVEQWQPRQP